MRAHVRVGLTGVRRKYIFIHITVERFLSGATAAATFSGPEEPPPPPPPYDRRRDVNFV